MNAFLSIFLVSVEILYFSRISSHFDVLRASTVLAFASSDSGSSLLFYYGLVVKQGERERESR